MTRRPLRSPELYPVAHATIRPRRSGRTHRGDAAPAAVVRPQIEADLALRSGGIGCLEVARNPNNELVTKSRRARVAASADRCSNSAGRVNHERQRHLGTRGVHGANPPARLGRVELRRRGWWSPLRYRRGARLGRESLGIFGEECGERRIHGATWEAHAAVYEHHDGDPLRRNHSEPRLRAVVATLRERRPVAEAIVVYPPTKS